ncbi:cyclin-like protein [Coniophora puteana RWD-64-598 SS2]|uniref:Cyclin-like protein n=1 Tax=Coniophora puteana (strain RWD-64-598) TaxID=741705 RepID=A0A5M3N6U9_CONPW|nr:cyclin-like protein [Coniophora puteana RWD-64-598 SS2]EIW86581.1 cyclin-like protein [Coniophora puteana RWD-64-598 SS2]
MATNGNATDASPTEKKEDQPKKPLYESSTQCKNWRYSPEMLADVRASMNEAAVAAIRNAFEADEPGSSASVSFLNAQDEQLLVKLYLSKIPQLCGHFRFPEEVEATAMTYLKRFYLRNTVMDWHPKNVMLTALFLATKTTNNPISLEAYAGHIPKTQPSDVLDLEFLVAQSLGFEFTVWHTHRALWGVWLDLQSLDIGPDLRPPDIYEAALNHVRTSRLTDAELIYTPSQIALGCLAMTSPILAQQWMESKAALAKNTHPTMYEILAQTNEEVRVLLEQTGQLPEVETVREVDRRLKLCKNPEKVVGSKAYLAKQAEDEHKAQQRRAKKAEQVRRAAESNDPFGNDIDEKQKEALAGDLDDDDD